MWYAVISEDNPNSTPLRAAARAAHLERLHALAAEGRLLLAGPHPAVDAVAETLLARIGAAAESKLDGIGPGTQVEVGGPILTQQFGREASKLYFVEYIKRVDAKK